MVATSTERTDSELLADVASLIAKVAPTANASLEASSAALVAAGKTTEALKQVIAASAALFAPENKDIEAPFNSLLFLATKQKSEDAAELVKALLAAVATDVSDKRSLERLRVLSVVFNTLDANSLNRFETFKALVSFAGATGHLQAVDLDFDTLADWIGQWGLTGTQTRALYRLIYDVLTQNKKSILAHKFHERLLHTYDTADAETLATVKESAEKCIKEAIAAPQIFQLDSLLQLAAVKQLEGSDIHNLLLIFVRDNFQAYEQFYNSHTAFVQSAGLSHEQNLVKMRILTLVTLASTSSEVEFSRIAETLSVPQEEVEAWVIEAITAKLIEAKIDQLNGKIVIGRATHRIFGKPQWQQLHDRLSSWQNNLNDILVVIKNAKSQAQQHGTAPVAVPASAQ
ncbi:eukaryotic translation initiation factor 3 [Capsaspora owczarzaki ATCC 30864]|uniref:Eukaryotic translation initiation factor 3 subunit M n=1 Tax=Capsaspora owczarzaki (strain ATCC 30864) TaxID=595528 RepID=A0A0D2WWT5_CAPO3|nr:eukaryotic translation initiation factor 3 [Capsaspora owczarzaki ATCC 30864]KJE97495.1 eukaryotic translation initiation factor 3 [Capsaspora owczarzaki ATCC 30864]|eukprot:XP_004343203.1 eukaryotic translation initiation factor 3 [Capsaspora owczarzaki ATCC 30864]